MCDNDQGIALAVDHLVSLGHRRIAFAFREEEVFGELAPRRHAFVRHLKRNGIEPADEDIIALQVDSLERSFDRFRRYTGLVTVNDGAASLVLDYAERAGFPIPDKLSVVGFDSTPFCLGLRPRLTSVFQPLAAMGRYASDLLVKSIRDETPDPFNIVLPCSLDLRDSTMSLAST
jgi:LacI family transcriptional regulator